MRNGRISSLLWIPARRKPALREQTARRYPRGDQRRDVHSEHRLPVASALRQGPCNAQKRYACMITSACGTGTRHAGSHPSWRSTWRSAARKPRAKPAPAALHHRQSECEHALKKGASPHSDSHGGAIRQADQGHRGSGRDLRSGRYARACAGWDGIVTAAGRSRIEDARSRASWRPCSVMFRLSREIVRDDSQRYAGPRVFHGAAGTACSRPDGRDRDRQADLRSGEASFVVLAPAALGGERTIAWLNRSADWGKDSGRTCMCRRAEQPSQARVHSTSCVPENSVIATR